MFDRILIANRGEIACRVIDTARRLGIRTVAVYSEADADALHVRLADEAYPIGGAAAADSYLRIETIVEVARHSGAQAVHPGYGFLSENPVLAEACAAADIVFVGPPADVIRAMGAKDQARRIMEEAEVPVVPGYHDDNLDLKVMTTQARLIGFPVAAAAAFGLPSANSIWPKPSPRRGARRNRLSATTAYSSKSWCSAHAISRCKSSPTHAAMPCICTSETALCKGATKR